MNIKDKIYNTIKDFNMFRDTKKILVGVSGGADSVCLLHALNHFSRLHDIKIFAVHINHCIRGAEADRDENFVRNFCKSMNVPFYLERVNVPEISLQMKIGMEECGRDIRYKIFHSIAEKIGAKISTAHTLSDSIETVFLNVARGCSINGICGIPAVRGEIIRPLIYLSRDEVESYCREYGLEYVYDSSNGCKDYNRNRIRLEVIPSLKKINPSFEKCFRRFLDSVSEDKKYLENICNEEYVKTIIPNEKYKYNIKNIKNLPSCIKDRVIYKILENLSGKEGLENKHVSLLLETVSDNESGCITLPGGVPICIKGDILYKKDSENIDKESINWEYELKEINSLTPLGITFIIKVVKKEEFNVFTIKNNKNVVGILDYDKIPKGSVFRSRREKDTFTPANRGITKSIKKLFNELKISSMDRYRIPMIVFGSKVIWIYGVGESEFFKVDKNTQNIALILKGESIDDRQY